MCEAWCVACGVCDKLNSVISPDGPLNTSTRFVSLEPSDFRASSHSLMSFCFLALTHTCNRTREAAVHHMAAASQRLLASRTSLADSDVVWDPEENDDGASESRAADVVRRATGLSRCAAGAAAEALERARFICRTLYHSGA